MPGDQTLQGKAALWPRKCVPGSARLKNNYERFLMGGVHIFNINMRKKRNFFDNQSINHQTEAVLSWRCFNEAKTSESLGVLVLSCSSLNFSGFGWVTLAR